MATPTPPAARAAQTVMRKARTILDNATLGGADHLRAPDESPLLPYLSQLVKSSLEDYASKRFIP